MYRTVLIVLILIRLFFPIPTSSADTDFQIYETGTRFAVTARWWGLSALGNMEILRKTDFDGKDVILVRSRVTKLGGLLGFIVKFLRIYKESNTFDSYIDPDTRTTARYEVYKLDDGSKKLTEHIYFDREQNRIVSLIDNRTILSNVAPDIQDAFSIFLDLLHKFNTEDLFIGKKFQRNLYAYEKAFKLEIEVTHLSRIDGREAYTMEIERLPEIFKYPASITFVVTDIEDGFKFPTGGECTIHIRALPDITVSAKLRKE